MAIVPSSLYDRVKFFANAGGLTDFVVSIAATGFLTPGQAGITDSTPVSYTAQSSDFTQWETGHGTYSVGATAIQRTTIIESSNANAKVNFANPPLVWLDVLAQDIQGWSNCINAGDARFGNIYTSPRATIQAAIDYCFNNGYQLLRIPANLGNNRWNLDGPLFIDPPNNLRSGISLANQKLGVTAAPTVFTTGISVICDNGCIFNMNWNSSPCIWIGTNNINRLANARIVGPAITFFGGDPTQLAPLCVGIAIAAGNGGAIDTVVENCYVGGCYAGFTTGSNGQNSLGEDNRWINCFTGYQYVCAYGIQILNSQGFPNLVVAGAHQGQRVTFYSTSQPIMVIGGEHGPSSSNSASGAFTPPALVSFSDTYNGVTFTNYYYAIAGDHRLADGGIYFNYNLFNMPSFGRVPFVFYQYNAGAGETRIKIDPGWVTTHYGEEVAITATTFATEFAALTTSTSIQRAVVFAGAITAIRCHIETNACVALYDSGPTLGHAEFIDMDFSNWNPGASSAPQPGRDFNLATPWCRQQVGNVIFRDCYTVPAAQTNNVDPGIIIQGFDFFNGVDFDRFIVSGGAQAFALSNLWYSGSNGGDARRNGAGGYDNTLNSYSCIGSKTFGFGEWDRSYWTTAQYDQATSTRMRLSGTGVTKYNGYRPAPGEMMRLTMNDANTLMGATPSNGPSLCGGTMCKVSQLGTVASVGGPVTSGSQNFTHCVDIGGAGFSTYADITLTGANWSATGQTVLVRIPSSFDINNFFFHGQEIGLQPDDLSQPLCWYIVRGIYINFGYIIVHRESASASVLVGAAGTIYTGSVIKQRKPMISIPAQTRVVSLASPFTKTGDTGLVAIPNFSLICVSGLKYKLTATLYTTSDISCGIKLQLASDGTLAVSSLAGEIEITNGAAIKSQTRLSALGTTVGFTAVTAARVDIWADFIVSTTGSVNIQFACNANTGTSATVLALSDMEVTEAPL